MSNSFVSNKSFGLNNLTLLQNPASVPPPKSKILSLNSSISVYRANAALFDNSSGSLQSISVHRFYYESYFSIIFNLAN